VKNLLKKTRYFRDNSNIDLLKRQNSPHNALFETSEF